MNWPNWQASNNNPDLRLLSNTPMQFLIGAALLMLGLTTEIPWMHEYSAAILVIRLSMVFGMLGCSLISARYPTRAMTESLIFGGMIINIIGMAILGSIKNTYLETSTPVIYQTLAFIAIFMAIRLPIFGILVSSVGIIWFWLMPLLLKPQLDNAMLISHFFGFVTYAVMVLIGKHLLQQLMCVEKRQSKQLKRMEALQELAIRDTTSGAYNQQYFQKLLPEYVSHARDFKLTFSLCMLALPAGGTIQENGKLHALRVKRFAKTILDIMRSGDAFFRIGNSLFAILLPETKAKSAARIAERIQEQWQESDSRLQTGGDSRHCCAIGVAEFNAGSSTSSSILQAAEAAVTKANTTGNNSIVIENE